jgi:hypothetical protein
MCGSQFSHDNASDPRTWLDWIDGQAEWLELIDVSGLEERHRQAAERATACLRDLRAAGDLHDTHPVVASLIQASNGVRSQPIAKPTSKCARSNRPGVTRKSVWS